MNLLLLLTGLSGAQDPWALIQRSERARTVPMEAVVRTTFWKPGKEGHGKTMRFRLIQDNGSVRVEPLEGGPRLEARHGKLEGHGKGPMPLPPRLPDTLELNLARRNYLAILEPSDSISGRRCEVIRLKPKNPGGNGRRLWIDPVTGLALRRDQYNERGELLRSSTMESVQHLGTHAPAGENPPPPDAAPQPHPESCPPDPRPLSSTEAARWLGFEPPKPTWIPDGYVAAGTLSHSCPEGGHAVRMSWSDGLSNFSVFVQPQGCLRPPKHHKPSLLQRIGGWLHPRRKGMGPPMVIAQLGNKAEVVALGDVPRPQLTRVVQSMGTPARPVYIQSQTKPPKEHP